MKRGRKPYKTHRTHAASRLGLLLNRLPEGGKWLWPVYVSRQLRLDEFVCESPTLPPEMDGLRVAYASDIHYGAFFDAKRAAGLAEKLNALDADILILGGDYGENGELAAAFFSACPPLKARLAVCGVLGNHDYAAPTPGSQAVTRAMYASGVMPLVNSALDITLAGKRLTVCAVDDIYHGAPDFPGVAAQAKGADFVIFAPHAPDALPDALDCAPEPFFDLALCGHTHGGQVRVLGFAPYTASMHGMLYGNRRLSGLYEEGRAQILVSNGVGVTWLPVRVGAPAQYHVVTLRRSEF